MATELIYMRDDLVARLLLGFPWLEERSGDIVHCLVGVGWFNLLSDLFAELELLYTAVNKHLDNLSFYEIKEKYGVLRVDMNDGVQGLSELFTKYENLSSEVCEACGEPGELRDRSWQVVLCEECLNKDNT